MAKKKQTPTDAGAAGDPPLVAEALDQRALKALFGTYWTAGGWRSASGNTQQTPPPPAAEVEYAKKAGYMFEPRPMTHDQIVGWLCRVRTAVAPREVADAFLASLSTRRLDWRSALGSYAVARHFPEHPFSSTQGRWCGVCGFTGGPDTDGAGDLSVLNFERFKWGGVRHLHAVDAAFDLELFARAGKPAPCADDFAIMNRLIEAVRCLDADARPSHLERVLGGLLPSKAERRVLIEILGYSGVLQDPDHPGFLHGFTPPTARRSAANHGDWSYPVQHWRGRHGVNREALAFWFGAYGKSDYDPLET